MCGSLSLDDDPLADAGLSVVLLVDGVASGKKTKSYISIKMKVF